jgi:hypothetical protein
MQSRQRGRCFKRKAEYHSRLTPDEVGDLIRMLAMTALNATHGLATAMDVSFELALETVLQAAFHALPTTPKPNLRLIVTPED